LLLKGFKEFLWAGERFSREKESHPFPLKEKERFLKHEKPIICMAIDIYRLYRLLDSGNKHGA
jgi:hypothetical protein